MKNWTIAKLGVGLILATLPLGGGCVQEFTNDVPTAIVATNISNSLDAAATPANEATDVAAQDSDLETAPSTVVSTPAAPPAGAALNAPAKEIVRLAESGLDDSVMLAYVTNSPSTFNLDADQIIYLNDIGLPGNVVAAMIQHDQSLKLTSTPPPVPQTYTGAPATTPEAQPSQAEFQPAPAVAEAAPPPQENVTYTYFYDSLSPYGTWVDIEGYGRCWRPSVCAVNRGWSPYCQGGRWIYTDCGWYWASDYSWGWAPFHYGRWFQHRSWGWCWAPDTCWGPSWVSWRYSPGYCGWAPLPPSACYTPGLGFTYRGRSVGVSFGFGLDIGRFTFVSAGHFCDPHPIHHRIPSHDLPHIFSASTVINPVVEDRGGVHFHRGIPPNRITQVTHTEIKPVRIREIPDRPDNHIGGERFDRDNGTLAVFRPHLPEPPQNGHANLVGQGVKAAPIGKIDRPLGTQAELPHRSIPFNRVNEAGAISAPRNPSNEPNLRDPVITGNSSGAGRITRPNNPEFTPNPEFNRGVPLAGNQSQRPNRDNNGNNPRANTQDMPLNSMILHGRSQTISQPRNVPPASGLDQQNPSQNRPFASSQPNTGIRAPQGNTTVFQGNEPIRREQPAIQQAVPRLQQAGEGRFPSDRISTQPMLPAPRPDNRIFQSPAATPSAPAGYNQIPQRTQPSISSQPSAPRVEIHQSTPAPQAPRASPAQNGNGNGGGNRQNSDHSSGRR